MADIHNVNCKLHCVAIEVTIDTFQTALIVIRLTVSECRLDYIVRQPHRYVSRP